MSRRRLLQREKAPMKLIELSFSDRSSPSPPRSPPFTRATRRRTGMADRLAEPDDAAVDELKRKARRRLVGAIVLALAAAIVVPMLLERDPRPLGDEVSVKIPPV